MAKLGLADGDEDHRRVLAGLARLGRGDRPGSQVRGRASGNWHYPIERPRSDISGRFRNARKRLHRRARKNCHRSDFAAISQRSRIASGQKISLQIIASGQLLL
jgi:hypothetical protein